MKHHIWLVLLLLLVLGAGLFRSILGKDGRHPSFVINEIQSANIDQFMAPSGNFNGWIELYPTDTRPLTLKGLYISDDSTQLKKSKLVSVKEKLLPKDYAVCWFGGPHAAPEQIRFTLNAEGGTLYISNERGEILIRQTYPKGLSRTSWSRTTDGGSSWAYTASPTLGCSNDKAVYASRQLEIPDIDTDSKLFTTPFEVHVSIPEGAQLRYTLDGTPPTLEKGLIHHGGTFTIRQTTLLRCRLFQKGRLPSPIATRSYIYETRKFNVPILSIVTDSLYLYDNEIGIYVRGKNGKPGNGRLDACNWNMDWNRPVHVDFLTEDGKMAVNQEADFCISGGWSRRENPKPFKIKAKKKYDGMNLIPYQVFRTKPHIRHKTWQVRNGGGKKFGLIKDAALQEIILSSGIDIDGQACQPVAHYINGKYMGMLNIREPNNKDFAEADWGWNDEEIDHFSITPRGYQQTRGTDTAFNEWYHLSTQAASPSQYSKIRDLVDVDEFINYMAIHLYLGCQDFAKNNVKSFRPRIENGRFRFTLHDLDSGIRFSDPFKELRKKRYYTFNDWGTDFSSTQEIKIITVFFNMLKNESFRKQFVDTYTLLTGSIFENVRCKHIVDSLVLQREQVLYYEGKTSADVGHRVVQRLRGRQEQMLQLLEGKSYLQLNTKNATHLKLSSDTHCGNLSINNLPIPTNRFDGKICLPATLQANTPAGFRFLGWKTYTTEGTDTLFTYASPWDYYDKGSLDGTKWQTYETGNKWQRTAAPFVYPSWIKRIISSVFHSEADQLKNSSTYYFHKTFKIHKAPQEYAHYILTYNFNHGIAVYINGKELIREKLPRNEINYLTPTFYAHEKPGCLSCNVPSSLLHKGDNHIAVELHKTSLDSPEIFFDAQLTAHYPHQEEKSVYLSKEEELIIDLPSDEPSIELTACFKPVSDKDRKATETPVVINEISASNGIFVNEYLKRRDWIELYNTTGQVIDLDGMYLSDKKGNAHLFQIQKEHQLCDTRIQPYGYKIIWADRCASLRELHADFKLAHEGGTVTLTAEDDSWCSSLKYGPHTAQQSIGRYPDGREQLYIMTRPTIGKPNHINSYTVPSYPIAKTARPLQLDFKSNRLVLSDTRSSLITLTVHDITGRLRLQQVFNGGLTLVPLNGLREGIYTAQAVNSNGQEQTIRFTVRR